MAATLLVEILTEELPPKSLRRLSEAFLQGVSKGLANAQLASAGVGRAFATPRRLAVSIPDVASEAADREIELTGPSTKAPEQAVAGFARKAGLPVIRLERRNTLKGEVYVARIKVNGAVLDQELGSIVEGALKSLPIPKVMRWGDGDAQFVRPVHGLVMIHGTRIVPGEVLGLESSNRTRGHRFMGRSDISLTNADEYDVKLKNDGMVVADFAARRAEIERQLKAEAAHEKAELGSYADLLDEVTALVEYPSVYAGSFEAGFLDVPQECLILTMRQNQKYFPLFDSTGKLLPKFLIVSNMKVADPRHIIGGNERVVRPRLEDARFFYNQDRRVRLEARVPQLSKVVYHNKLGSQLDRVQRIQLLAGSIARNLKADAAQAERAAWLSKADLLTGMVGEFPELQGVMGRYYALHDGEAQAVANAIESHYRPRFSGDQLPSDAIGCAVALADKLDALVGIFGIAQFPTGEKDPFGLRRHALGLIRILCERKLPLELHSLLKDAHNNFPDGTLIQSHERADISVPNYVEVEFFVKDRAKGYLRELGYSSLEVESVLDLNPLPAEYVERLNAAKKFLRLPEAAGLAEADKRIRNILDKSGGSSVVQLADETKFQTDEERKLLRAARVLRPQVDSLLADGKFSEALILTAQVHSPVTQFFEKVMVNVDDLNIRTNRFALLHEVVNLTNRVANISKLAQ